VTNVLSEIIQRCEWIGVIGSASSNTIFNVDAMEEAYQKGLVGNFCIAEFKQDGHPAFALGQVVSIVMENPYLERHSVRKIVSVRGEANPLTEKHDVRRLEMMLGSAYSWSNERVVPIIVSSVPPTGTRIHLLSQAVVDELTKQQKTEITVVGKLYNTSIHLPTIFRHFGKGVGGLGEAYHLGIFGKTGSGKSVLAKMVMAAYARHDDMSILVVDPQGEYGRELTNDGQLKGILSRLKRNASVFDISRIALADLDSLKRILIVSGFVDVLGVRAEENRVYAAEVISDFFARVHTIPTATGTPIHVSLSVAGDRVVFERLMDQIRDNIRRIYIAQEAQTRVLDTLAGQRERLYNRWVPIANLFSIAGGKVSIDRVVQEAYRAKNFTVIDLSEISARDVYWSDKVMAIIIKDIMKSLKDIGGTIYRRGDLLNLLVVTDEAHRLVPRETPTDEDFKTLKDEFVDAVLTTRKYGLGWMFISPSLASLELEILRQLRLYFFGYGLSWGGERRVLEELVGRGAHIDLYQSFRDPQTSAILGQKQYPFMVHGPVSPLSVSGGPLFFTALDYFSEFSKANPFLS
jgi:ABC-type dipeptide/oligopeptide/nickel transport system ATPase component